jgi:hypothetical protein
MTYLLDHSHQFSFSGVLSEGAHGSFQFLCCDGAWKRKKTRNILGCTMAINVEVYQINRCIGTTKGWTIQEVIIAEQTGCEVVEAEKK